MAEARFVVSQIHCGACAERIETVLSRLEGVRRVSADPQAQTVNVRYNDQAIDEPELEEHLDRLGYPVQR
jgi:Cu2+-exporting ATPase